mgnify:CR=1 FL=1
MQITLNLPDSLSHTETFNQSDWLREIAIALFQQERIWRRLIQHVVLLQARYLFGRIHSVHAPRMAILWGEFDDSMQQSRLPQIPDPRARYIP